MNGSMHDFDIAVNRDASPLIVDVGSGAEVRQLRLSLNTCVKIYAS